MNQQSKRLWVLGASKPEMDQIAHLLTECGESVTYAVGQDGQRVHSENSYRAVGTVAPDGTRPDLDWDTIVFLVECDGGSLRDSLGITFAEARSGHPGREFRVIDHHRPGDPGYGWPPREFLAASSIGQVIAELAKTGALRRAIPKEHEIAYWMASHDNLPVAEYNEMLRTQWFWSRQEEMPGPDPYASAGTIARGVSFLYDGYCVAVRRNDFYFERRVALIPRPLIYAAAADHCLAAAYRGECPGVDPDALMRWHSDRELD